MENTHGSYSIEDYPEAVRIIKINNIMARRLGDLLLHHHDVLFSLECLDKIKDISDDNNMLNTVLWESAIIHFIKCFGDNKSRFQLSFEKINNKNNNDKKIFEYFKNLRNKHIIHDENAYSQYFIGAVINKPENINKIGEIVMSTLDIDSLSTENIQNLNSLIVKVEKWLTEESGKIIGLIKKDLDKECYEKLLHMETANITVSDPDSLIYKREII